MTLQLQVTKEQAAKVKAIVELLSQATTGETMTFDKCLENQKVMTIVSEQLVNRIIGWSKKVDSLNKLKAKKPSTELARLKKIDAEENPKAVKKSKSTTASKKKSSKPAATASES